MSQRDPLGRLASSLVDASNALDDYRDDLRAADAPDYIQRAFERLADRLDAELRLVQARQDVEKAALEEAL